MYVLRLNKLPYVHEIPKTPAGDSDIANTRQARTVRTLEPVENGLHLPAEPILNQPFVGAATACERVSFDADER